VQDMRDSYIALSKGSGGCKSSIVVGTKIEINDLLLQKSLELGTQPASGVMVVEVRYTRPLPAGEVKLTGKSLTDQQGR
jgi:hypothetical protein